MNFETIQARAAVLASVGGWTDVTPPPDWPALVNQAQADFFWDAECLIGTENVNTVIGTAEYTLTGTFKSIQDCYYDTASTKKPLEPYSERALRADDPKWLYAANAVPQCFILVMQSTLRLFPTPNAVKVVLVRGIKLPADMDTYDDIPPCPGKFHEVIAKRAAVLQGEIWARGEEAVEVAKLQAKYEQGVAEYRKGIAPSRSRGTSRIVAVRQPRRFRL